MRIDEVISTNPVKYRDHRIHMDETVVKPYLKYLESIGSYLSEDATSAEQLKQAVVQAGNNPENIVLPPQIKQNFAQQIDKAPVGPVQNFGPQAQAELAKIQDPQLKQTLLQKAKEAVKNPDTQQTILSAISSIAGMAAGAASLGLGAEAAKSATKTIGNGLLGILNARLSGANWKTAIKHGAAVGTTHAAADQLDVDADNVKKAVGVQSPAGQQTTAQGQQPAQTTGQAPAQQPVAPADVAKKWQEFINYGQKLVQQMAAQNPQAKPAAA